jgi:adenine C2-methylase RlmN of 23S rRNA A2503 and tRNA A37
MDLDQVAEVLAGEPAYRVHKVWEWAARGASSSSAMTNLPARSRALLAELGQV